MGNISLKTYGVGDSEKWDSFVEASRNGTIFHKQRFLSYHPPGRFRDRSLIFREGEKIISLLPACLIEENGIKTLASHQGSTYGGFVIPFKFGIERALAVVDSLLEFSSKEGIKEIRMRCPEYVFEKAPSEEIKFAMWHRGFEIDYSELSTCYDLGLYGTETPVVYEAGKSRKMGVSFLYDDDNFDEFYGILSDNLKSKYEKTPTHTLQELYGLKGLLKEKLVLIGGYHGKTLLGGLVVFLANQKTAHIFYMTGKKGAGTGININDALVDYAIRKFKKAGFGFLNFGISTEEKGRKVNLALFRFKEKFKGFGICREVWRWNA